MQISLTINFQKEGGFMVAYVPALDLSSHGKDLEEAQENIDEAIKLWIEVCREKGTLHKALLELGWKKTTIGNQRSFVPPKVMTVQQSVAIPA